MLGWGFSFRIMSASAKKSWTFISELSSLSFPPKIFLTDHVRLRNLYVIPATSTPFHLPLYTSPYAPDPILFKDLQLINQNPFEEPTLARCMESPSLVLSE